MAGYRFILEYVRHHRCHCLIGLDYSIFNVKGVTQVLGNITAQVFERRGVRYISVSDLNRGGINSVRVNSGWGKENSFSFGVLVSAIGTNVHLQAKTTEVQKN